MVNGSMSDFLQKQWNLIVGVAAWIGSILGGFWRAPPPSTPDASSDVAPFGQFFLTLAIGLIAIPAYRYRGMRHMWYWLAPGILLVLAAPVAFLSYDYVSTDWTCQYAGGRVLVGPDSGLTDHGKAYFQQNPTKRCEDVIWDHAGKVYVIWTKRSVERRRLVLNILYVASLPLLAAGMVCVIQAFYCGTRAKST
jgi:hypothetical protein